MKQTTTLRFAFPLLAALLVRLLLLLFWEQRVVFDGEEYVNLGVRIASGAGFVDDAGTPYLFRAPGFPYLLGWIYSLFGTSKIASALVLLLLEFLTVPLVAIIATKIGGTAAGVRSAWIWGLQPFSAAIALAHHSDSVALLLLALVWLVIAFRSDKPVWLLLAGFLTGLLALVRPIFQILPLLIWLAVFPLTRFDRTKIKAMLLSGILIIVGYGIVVCPWMMRNERVGGSFSVALQAGGNFYIGWHEGSSGGYEYTDKMDEGAPAFTTYAEWNRTNFHRALQFITSHPVAASKLLVMKIAKSFIPFTRDWVLYQPSLQTGSPWAPANQSLPLFLLLTLYSTALLAFGWWSWSKFTGDTPVLRLMSATVILAFASMWVFIVDPRYALPAGMAFAIFIGCRGDISGRVVRLSRLQSVVKWSGIVLIILVAIIFIGRRLF